MASTLHWIAKDVESMIPSWNYASGVKSAPKVGDNAPPSGLQLPKDQSTVILFTRYGHRASLPAATADSCTGILGVLSARRVRLLVAVEASQLLTKRQKSAIWSTLRSSLTTAKLDSSW